MDRFPHGDQRNSRNKARQELQAARGSDELNGAMLGNHRQSRDRLYHVIMPAG